MYLKWHFISSIILAILLYPFFRFQVFWILIGGFFVDFDHYLVYFIKFKKYNITEARNYFDSRRKFLLAKKKTKNVFCLFHTIEFILLTAFLSIYLKFIFLVFIGLILHLILDIIDAIEIGAWNRDISFLNWLRNPKTDF